MKRIKKIIKPGYFSLYVPADKRREEFDTNNEALISNDVHVDFVFIGDSITEGWELNAYFGGKNKIAINRGISGDTAEYLVKRFEADTLQLKPDYCVILIGINDASALESLPNVWVPTGRGRSMESVEKIRDRVVKCYISMLDQAKKYSQKLVICSILPSNIPKVSEKNNERNKYVALVNSDLKSICEKEGCIFVDYHSRFADCDGLTLKTGLSDDGVHPNVSGYNLMADILRTTLAEYCVEI